MEPDANMNESVEMAVWDAMPTQPKRKERMKPWRNVLGLDKAKKDASTMDDGEQKSIIFDHIKKLSQKKCYFKKCKKERECCCLSHLDDDFRLVQAVGEHVFSWAHKNKEEADTKIVRMLWFPVVAEELMKRANVKSDKGKHKKLLSGKNSKSIPLPYVQTDDDGLNNKLKYVYRSRDVPIPRVWKTIRDVF